MKKLLDEKKAYVPHENKKSQNASTHFLHVLWIER